MTDRVAPHRSEPIFDAEANLAALYGKAPAAPVAPPMPPGDVATAPAPRAGGVAHFQAKDNFVPSFGQAWFLGAGRMSRLPYFFTTTMIWILNLVAVATLPGLLALIVVLVGSWASITAGIRRLHDRGHTGWMTLGLFVPILNLGLSLYMLFAPGDPGPNKYGRY